MGRFRRRGNDDNDDKKKQNQSSSDRRTFGRRDDDRNSGGGLRSDFGRNRSVASSSGDPGGRSPFGRRGNDDDKEEDSGGRRPFGRSTGSSPASSSPSGGQFSRRGGDDKEEESSGSRLSFGRGGSSPSSSPPSSSGGRTPFGRRGGEDDKEEESSGSRLSFGRGGGSPSSSPPSSSGGRTPFGRRGGEDDKEEESSGSRLSFGRGGSSPSSSPPSSSGGRTPFGRRGGEDDKEEESSGSRLSFGRGGSSPSSSPPSSSGGRTPFGGRSGDDREDDASSRSTFGRSPSGSSPSPASRLGGDRPSFGARDTGQQPGGGSSSTFGRAPSTTSPPSPSRTTGERSAIGGRDSSPQTGTRSTGTFGRTTGPSSPSTPSRTTGERSAIGGRDSSATGGRGTGTFGRTSPAAPTRSTGERDKKEKEGGGRGLFGRSKPKEDAPARPTRDKKADEKKSRFGGVFSRSTDKAQKPDRPSTERGAKPSRETPAKPAKAARASTKAKSLPHQSAVPRIVGDGLSLDRKLDLLGGAMVALAAVMVFGWLQTTFSTTPEAQGFMAEIDVLFAKFFGIGRVAIVIVLAYFGGWLLVRHFGREFTLDKSRLMGYGILYLCFMTTLQWWDLFFIDFPNKVNYVATRKILYEQSLALAEAGKAGGYLGHVLYTYLHSAAGDWVVEVFLFSMWLLGFYLALELTVEKLANRYIEWREGLSAKRAVEVVEPVPSMVPATATVGAAGGSTSGSSTTRRQQKDVKGRKAAPEPPPEKTAEDGTTRKAAEVQGRTEAPSDAPVTAATDGDTPKRSGRGLFGRGKAPSDAPITAATDGEAPKRRGMLGMGRKQAPEDAVAEPAKPERRPAPAVDAAAAITAASVSTEAQATDDKPQRQGLIEQMGRTTKPDEKPDAKSDDSQSQRRGLADRLGRTQSETDDKSGPDDGGDGAPKRRERGGLFGRGKAPDEAKPESRTTSQESADKTPERAVSPLASRLLSDSESTSFPARSSRSPEVSASAVVSAAAVVTEAEKTQDMDASDEAPSATPERRPSGLSDRLSRRPSIAARPSPDEDGDNGSPPADAPDRGFPARRPSITSRFGRQTSENDAPGSTAQASASPARIDSRESGILGRRSPSNVEDTVPTQVKSEGDQDEKAADGKGELEDTQNLEPTVEIQQPARPASLLSRRPTMSQAQDEESKGEDAAARRSPFAARPSTPTPSEEADTASSIFRRRTVADAPPTDLPGRRPSSEAQEDFGKRDDPFARPALKVETPSPAASDDDGDDDSNGQNDRLSALIQKSTGSDEFGDTQIADDQPVDEKSSERDFSDAARIAVEGAAMAKTGALGRRLSNVEEDEALPTDLPARPRGLPRPESDTATTSDMFRRPRADLLLRRQSDSTEGDAAEPDQPETTDGDSTPPVAEAPVALAPVSEKSADQAIPVGQQLGKPEMAKEADADQPVRKADKSKDDETDADILGIAAPKAKEKSVEAKPKSDQGEKAAAVQVPAAPRWSKPEFITLLEEGSEQEIDQQYLLERARLIEDTLESFGAPGRVVEVNTGPVITQFGVEPDYIERRGGSRSRVKVSAIASLDRDLALALAAKSIRIQAPVPGKGFVGIEVPNAESDLVSLRDVMNSKAHEKMVEKSGLTIGLGKRVDGGTVSADLTEMPHLLIAGATGSGKSVCVNAIICCLLLQNTPDDLQFIMVDPKRVELAGYNGIPHLVAPVVVDLERIVGVLKWVQREMDDRYRRFAAISARNIDDYNIKRAPEIAKMPYLVVVVDELADLMMLAPDETERLIARLAQMARATGIHLVISTQRPSVDVVTGLIKANFPARIAFAVASSVDSRVILDQPGAEKLLGRGDMLYQAPDAPAPLRMQGVYVSDPEINRITQYWKSTQALARKDGQPQLPLEPPKDRTAETPPLPRIISRSERVNGGDEEEAPTLETSTQRPPLVQRKQDFWQEVKEVENEDEDDFTGDGDDLYEEAVDVVRTRQRASISMLQRTFRIGYTRAARLIDIMEENGVVGPAESGAKPRKVLLPPPDDEDED